MYGNKSSKHTAIFVKVFFVECKTTWQLYEACLVFNFMAVTN